MLIINRNIEYNSTLLIPFELLICTYRGSLLIFLLLLEAHLTGNFIFRFLSLYLQLKHFKVGRFWGYLMEF